MMTKSFHKTTYSYKEKPPVQIGNSFGVYIHVPFCFTKCSFCPFYKEIYEKDKKIKYLEAIKNEIENSCVSGNASWVYFGGGTPNTLKIDEVKSIVDKLRENISISTMGIELLPSVLDEEYIAGLHKIGFTKISVGVESLSKETLSKSGRKLTERERINEIIKIAQDKGLWVNVDLMIGLPEQKPDSFIEDIKEMSEISPDQITIYPFMQLGKLAVKPSLEEDEQFEYIEKANDILINQGYDRKGIWTFAKGDEVYDSSRDELIEDYIGFGPAAFSTYGSWKVVNPELDIYLRNYETKKRMALVADKEETSDDWRKFARMLYDLKGALEEDVFFGIKLLVKILKITGFIKKGKITKKGILFTHTITKTVVENLPYPLQNTHYIENYEEYLSSLE